MATHVLLYSSTSEHAKDTLPELTRGASIACEDSTAQYQFRCYCFYFRCCCSASDYEYTSMYTGIVCIEQFRATRCDACAWTKWKRYYHDDGGEEDDEDDDDDDDDADGDDDDDNDANDDDNGL